MSFLVRYPPQRVAVLRALQLGDMLCAVPALRALRQALPEAHITLVGLPWASAFCARFAHLVDEFIAFPGCEGLPERVPDASAWPAFLADIRARRFDLALQLHGDGRLTNAIVAQFGARRTAGFCPSGHGRAAEGYVHWPEHGPEVLRLLELVAALGAPPAGTELEFPLRATDRAELALSGLDRGLARGAYACVHPGARWAGKRWPAAHFAAVGQRLHRELGLEIVITGSAVEHALACEVALAMDVPCVNAAAPISIGALAALIADARLLVANDTGVSHLAAALGVPSVIVFSASDVQRWAPLDRARHRVVRAGEGRAEEAVLRQAKELMAEPASAFAA